MNLNDAAATTIDIVDDVELLAILGLSAPSSPTLCDNTSIAVLDWEDMPELSEEEDEDDNNSINNNNNNNKRKFNDEDEDIFAEFDFVEVSIQPPEKKQKTLLIQQPFVSEDSETILSSPNVQLNEEDIRLALDLISSA
ncbi:unnamed protein product [Mucor hiemalis]